jgi:D-3-phosphoglycerate dehydrogenase
MVRIFLTHTPDTLANYYGERALAGLRDLGEVRKNTTGKVLDATTLAEVAQGCEIIVSDRQTPGPAEFFSAAPDLAAFLRCAVDIRNIDVDAASAAGVLVTRASPGFAASVAVAEMALGMMVDLARGVSRSVIAYRIGEKPPVDMGRQLKGATLGIVGYGAIGKYLAPLGAALGMRVLIADPYQTVENREFTKVELATLLAESDFVVCLAVANAETENLMDARAFAHMRPTAFFINL